MQLLPMKINQPAIADRPWQIKISDNWQWLASAANLLHPVEVGIKPSQITIFGPGRLGTGNAFNVIMISG
jgi:hypothetical protein